MCKAFSGVITIEGNVYWQVGLDSHEDIIDKFQKRDKLLIDDKLPANFLRFEIVPKDNNYLNPDGKWIFVFDDKKPKWWNKDFEASCWATHKKWKDKIYSSLNLVEARNPINPFAIEPPKKIMSNLKLLRRWASVRDSVRASVWYSVRDSVGASVRDSVGASVWYSVRAYISSLFPEIKKWEYCDFKCKGNPFQSAIDLWKMGLVPSFDGKVWRLHSKNGIEWEGKLK